MSPAHPFVCLRPLAFGGGDAGEGAIGIAEREREETISAERDDSECLDISPRNQSEVAGVKRDAGAVEDEWSAAGDHARDGHSCGEHEQSDSEPAENAEDNVLVVCRHVEANSSESASDRGEAELLLRRVSEFQTIAHSAPNQPLRRTSSSRASR